MSWLQIFCANAEWRSYLLTSNGSEARYNTRTGRWSGAVTALTFPLIHTGRGLHCDLMLKIYTKESDRVFLYIIYQIKMYCILHFPSNPPEGRLIQLLSRPSLRSRLFLKCPLRFLTCGFSWYIWWIMMFSSLSTMSISRSANSCSRLFNSSSCVLCSSAARASASSQERSSCVFKIVFNLCLRMHQESKWYIIYFYGKHKE